MGKVKCLLFLRRLSVIAQFGYKAVIDFQNEVVNGYMPNRALKLIFEWMEIHKDELLEDWELAVKGQPLNTIEPLK